MGFPSSNSENGGPRAANDIRASICERLDALRKRRTAEEEGVERRKSTRHAYSCRQLIAPYDSFLPPREYFQEVMCHDISKSGFSFLADEKPRSQHVVIALGVDPDIIYVTARVVRVAPLPGSARIIIGCEFVGRICV